MAKERIVTEEALARLIEIIKTEKADTQHTHASEDIVGLNNTMDTKADVEHIHDIADVTNLQSTLDTKVTEEDITDAIDRIKIGGRNLILNSGTTITNNGYQVHNYGVADFLLEGTVYTITICVTPASDVTHFAPYLSNGHASQCTMPTDGTTNKQIISKSFTAWYYTNADGVKEDYNRNATDGTIKLYRFPNNDANNGTTTIHWIKVEKGNKATDYTPAIEDIKALINTNATNISANAEDILINAEAIVDAGTRIDTIESAMTDIVTLTKSTNKIENAGNFVEFVGAKGNTLQNLFLGEKDPYLQFGTKTKDEHYITVSALDDASVKASLMTYFDATLFDPNTTYTLFLRETPPSKKVLMRDVTNLVNLTNVVEVDVNKSIVFTTTANSTKELCLYYYDLNVGDKVRIGDNVLILKGDYVYSGGKHAPNYFDGLKSVEDIKIISKSKNLFTFAGRGVKSAGNYSSNSLRQFTDGEGIYIGLTANNYYNSEDDIGFEILNDNSCNVSLHSGGYGVGVDFKVSPNTPYTLSYNGSSIMYTSMSFYDEEGRQIVYYNSASCVSPKNARYGVIIFRPTADDTFYNFSDIQLEVGETVTTFEPYGGETTLHIPLIEPLRKIGNNTYDEIVGNKIIRRVGKVDYDGSTDENWIYYYNATQGSSYTIDILDSVIGQGYSVCDKFRVISGGAWTSGYINTYGIFSDHMLNQRKYFRAPNDTVTNLDQWKTWLQSNPITVYYALLNPIEEDITELNEILETYQDGTIVLEDTNMILPSVDISYSIGITGRLNKAETEIADNRQMIHEVQDILTVEEYLDYWNTKRGW